ncbi:MAG: hypothetical protein HY925_04305 [Elusimicrobia bacterium]|nr:hypothetical protein [Elusimicrobiota bacterium]
MASSDRRSKKPQLVATGTFLVDRARALKKLDAFRVADPLSCIDWWLRAAIAAGARRIEADEGAGFDVSFDGRTFDPALADPASCLFAEDPDPALRHLSWGILSVLKLRVPSVTVISGTGTSRRAATFTPEGLEVEPVDDGGSDTRISAAFADSILDWREQLTLAYRACPAELIVGERVLNPVSKEDGYYQEKGKRRLFLRPEMPRSDAQVSASYYGVRVQELDWAETIVVSGFVDDPGFTLDASRAKLVRNAALKSAREEVAAAAERLSLSIIATQPERLADLRRWVGRLSTLRPGLTRVPEMPPDVREAAFLNDWLYEMRSSPWIMRKLPKRVAKALRDVELGGR